MKFDVLTDFEDIGLAAVCAFRHIAFTQVTNEFGRVCGVLWVFANKRRIKRPDRMDHAERALDVPIVGWDFGADDEVEDATFLDCFSLNCRSSKAGGKHGTSRSCH